jgi:site-specific recombinase XerD
MTLTEKLDAVMREQSLLPNTRSCYHGWAKAFYRFVKLSASAWQPEQVRSWLLELHRQNYSPVSRKQALCALVFVFKHVLRRELGPLDLPPMPHVRQTLRTIPTREEIARIFVGLSGQVKLMAAIMYGSGLRVNECCTLRVQDVDLEALTVRVWNGKGDKTRLTVLPVLRRVG